MCPGGGRRKNCGTGLGGSEFGTKKPGILHENPCNMPESAGRRGSCLLGGLREALFANHGDLDHARVLQLFFDLGADGAGEAAGVFVVDFVG
jgi:hypothetical protein